MADTALDYRAFLPTDDPLLTPEVRQQPPAVTPPPAPPPPAATETAPPPAPGPATRGFDTGPPPTAAPERTPTPGEPPAPAGAPDLPAPRLPSALTGIVDDEDEHKRAMSENTQGYKSVLREHSGEFRPLVRPQDYLDYKNHADYPKLDELKEQMKQLDPKTAKRYQPQVAALERKIIHDIDSRNAENEKARTASYREDLRRIDDQQTVEKADKIAGLVQGQIDSLYTKQTSARTTNNPQERERAEYNHTISPVTTMNMGTPDKPDLRSFRDGVTKIAVLNGMAPDTAMNYAMQITAPGGIDDKTNKPVPGLNGRSGKGYQNYVYDGHDARGHAIIRMPDGNYLRVDKGTLRMFETARLKGWQNSQTWHQQREQKRTQAQEPDLIERSLKTVRGWLN